MFQSFLKGEGLMSTRRVWLMALFVLGCLLPSQVEATLDAELASYDQYERGGDQIQSGVSS